MKPKILLAIDPLEDELRLTTENLAQLSYWVKSLGATVEAAYVLSDPESDPRVVETRALAKEALKNAVQDLDSGVQVITHLLVNSSSSNRKAVKTLTDFAKENHFSLIAVSSHGRRGISQFLMGSFAESLVEHSAIPILFLSSHSSHAESKTSHFELQEKVLFPTDFSHSSETAFREYLKFAKMMKPELVLLHVLPTLGLIAQSDMLFGFGAYLPNSYWKEQKETVISRAELLLSDARNAGLVAKFILTEQSINVVESVLKTAKEEHATLVALESSLGKISKAVIRSHVSCALVYGSDSLKVV